MAGAELPGLVDRSPSVAGVEGKAEVRPRHPGVRPSGVGAAPEGIEPPVGIPLDRCGPPASADQTSAGQRRTPGSKGSHVAMAPSWVLHHRGRKWNAVVMPAIYGRHESARSICICQGLRRRIADETYSRVSEIFAASRQSLMWGSALASTVEMQPRFHTTRGALFAYRVGSGRRENWVSRWVLPRAPGLARNVRAAAALAGWLWRVMWRADRAGGGAHDAWRDPSPQTTDSAGWIHMIRPAAGSRMDWRRSSSACLRMDPGAR